MEFFQRDAKSDHVRYVGTLINPLAYVAATVIAIAMYIDYLNYDHFDTLSHIIIDIPTHLSCLFN